MSTTLSIPRPTPRRKQIVASAIGLVAAAAVAVTLAVAGGGDGVAQPAASQPSAKPATAQPNAATLYRNESVLPSGPERQNGASAADRFHHFR